MVSKVEDLYYEFLYLKICIGARPYPVHLCSLLFAGTAGALALCKFVLASTSSGKSCTPKSSSSHAATRELEMPLCGKVIAYPTPSGGFIVLYAVVSQMRTVVVP